MDVSHLKDLRPDPQNRRKHTPRNIGMLVDALHTVGAGRSIVIDERGEVLAGNGVVEAAAEAGITSVQVVDVDGSTLVAVRRTGLTTEQKRALAIFDNRVAELAEWNWDQIAADKAAGLELAPWFTDEELAAGLKAAVKAGLTDAAAVPDERPTSIVPGDLFELGRHRLLCGDSTRPGDVARLMGDARAAVCFTSPPYGAGHVAKLRDHYVPGRDDRDSFYAEHDDDPRAWLALMRNWFEAVRPFVDAVLCNVQLLADNKRALLEWMHAYRAARVSVTDSACEPQSGSAHSCGLLDVGIL